VSDPVAAAALGTSMIDAKAVPTCPDSALMCC
jgi:hypothetical protein